MEKLLLSEIDFIFVNLSIKILMTLKKKSANIKAKQIACQNVEFLCMQKMRENNRFNRYPNRSYNTHQKLPTLEFYAWCMCCCI